jgi:hypothetical protein
MEGKTMKLEEVNQRTKEAVDFLVAALEGELRPANFTVTVMATLWGGKTLQ